MDASGVSGGKNERSGKELVADAKVASLRRESAKDENPTDKTESTTTTEAVTGRSQEGISSDVSSDGACNELFPS